MRQGERVRRVPREGPRDGRRPRPRAAQGRGRPLPGLGRHGAGPSGRHGRLGAAPPRGARPARRLRLPARRGRRHDRCVARARHRRGHRGVRGHRARLGRRRSHEGRRPAGVDRPTVGPTGGRRPPGGLAVRRRCGPG